MNKLQAELDNEGMDKLIDVLHAARVYTGISTSHPESEKYRRELSDATFAFNQWEAGAQVVAAR